MNDIIKRETTTFTIQNVWAKEVQLLKSMGFSIVDPSELIEFPETQPEDVVMAELCCRRMFVFILKDSHYEGDKNFCFYVQQDIGCGFTEMPVNWSEIGWEWINSFKKGFEGHGFNITL